MHVRTHMHTHAHTRTHVCSTRGIADVVPLQLLELMRWEDLEQRLCGGTIDIDVLRQHSTYGGGLTGEEPHIRFFWQTLKGFNDEQRRRFVRFVWAQERLPMTDDGWGSTRYAPAPVCSRPTQHPRSRHNMAHAVCPEKL